MQIDNLVFHLKKSFFEKTPRPNNYCLAGGVIRDLILDEKPKDYDIFVDSKETEIELIEFFKTNGKLINENDQLANITWEGKWVQVIKNKYWNVQTTEVIDNFDFSICCALVNSEGFKCREEFFRDLSTKHLRPIKLSYPLSSLQRMQKYIQKGFTACNGTLLDLAKAIQTVDLNIKNQNSLEFYPDGTPRFIGVD